MAANRDKQIGDIIKLSEHSHKWYYYAANEIETKQTRQCTW